MPFSSTRSSLIYLILLLSACQNREPSAPTETPTPTTPIGTSRTIYGKQFKFEPASALSDDDLSTVSAVAKIDSMDTGGTGVFVSPDGLFLTNEHIISALNCPDGICHNYKILRDYRPGGARQVFTRFRVIVSSPELDFTLVAVELPPGESVPYLSLLEDLPNEALKSGANITMAGHPKGASLMITDAYIDSLFASGQLILTANGMPGNSGSPLIYKGKMAGLYYGSNYNYSDADRSSGFFFSDGNGSSSESIVEFLRNYFPDISKIAPDQWRKNHFENVKYYTRYDRQRGLRHFPRARSKWTAEQLYSPENFFKIHYRQRSETSALVKVHERIIQDSTARSWKSQLQYFYLKLADADRANDRVTPLPEGSSLSEFLESSNVGTYFLQGAFDTVSLLTHHSLVSFKECRKQLNRAMPHLTPEREIIATLSGCSSLQSRDEAQALIPDLIRIGREVIVKEKNAGTLRLLLRSLQKVDSLNLLSPAENHDELLKLLGEMEENSRQFGIFADTNDLRTRHSP
jgi:hypothetical protein